MPESFLAGTLDVSAPGTRARVLTPSDTATLDPAPRSIYVGTGGDITMRGMNDQAAVLWKAVPAGTILPFRPSQVLATGTTASNLIGIH